jgi:predicted phage tail protein
VIAPVISGAGGNDGARSWLALCPDRPRIYSWGWRVFCCLGTSARWYTTAGALTKVGTVLFSLGASLVLTGIAGLLTPPVQTPSSDSKKKDSFMFDRAVELTTQGYPIPLLYGRYLAVSPLTISSAISTESIPV